MSLPRAVSAAATGRLLWLVAGLLFDAACEADAPGDEGAAAAFFILQHAIARPDVQRRGLAGDTQALERRALVDVGEPIPAEELVGAKAFFIRAGLFKDVDITLGSHVDSDFAVNWGQPERNSGLVSVQYSFHGKAAHAADHFGAVGALGQLADVFGDGVARVDVNAGLFVSQWFHVELRSMPSLFIASTGGSGYLPVQHAVQ